MARSETCLGCGRPLRLQDLGDFKTSGTRMCGKCAQRRMESARATKEYRAWADRYFPTLAGLMALNRKMY